MKVGTQQGNHQLSTGIKSLMDQSDRIDGIPIIVSTLNRLCIFLHFSLLLMMAMKITSFIIAHQQKTRVFLVKLGKLSQMLRTKE